MFNPFFDQAMKAARFILIPLVVLASSLTQATADWDEESALATLAVTAHARAEACQALAVIGGPKSVPTLAGLMDDRQLAAYARTALEVIDDPSAAKALRDALPKLEGQLLIGVVTSLGARRDREAVSALTELVNDSKRGASEAALVALARIGGRAPITTVIMAMAGESEELHIPAAHAALLAADSLSKRGNNNAANQVLAQIRKANLPEHIKQAAANQ
jgi:hypothetical protein